MAARTSPPNRDVLLASLKCGFSGPAWYGGPLLSALRKCPPEARAWAPPGRKSVWHQLLHAAYWKHRMLLRLGVERKFPRKGSNWPPLPQRTDREAWKADFDLLVSTHNQLLATVAALPEINEKTAFLIIGIAQHDVYHDGQIRLLTRLWKDAHGE